MNIAIITGASSGLGQEYACLADASNAFDELWLVARRHSRLEELAQKLSTPTRIFALDLQDLSSLKELTHALQKEPHPNIGLLVNAAGLGKFGTYATISQDEVANMIDINCRALVAITQLCLPYMHEGARILQIASSASFAPLPGLNVYAASKAFVRSYTRALRFELRGRSIHVTAVCPLWIKTEFLDVAGTNHTDETIKHPIPLLTAPHVARWSWKMNTLNLPVTTCCISGWIMRLCCKILPAWLIMWAWEGLRRV